MFGGRNPEITSWLFPSMMTDDQADNQKRNVFSPIDLLWFVLIPLLIYGVFNYKESSKKLDFAVILQDHSDYLIYKEIKSDSLNAIIFLSVCCVFLILFRIKWIEGFWEFFLENVWRPMSQDNSRKDDTEKPTKEIKYFLWINESQDGPYTIEELTQKLESGEIKDTSLCYPWDGSWEGMNQDDNWIQIKDLPNWTGFNPPSND